MFRFHKPLDIITLFHKASSPASVRIANTLKQAALAASETSTTDQPTARPEFKLEVTEEPPTEDQLRTILQYVGNAQISSIIPGAINEKEALRKFQQSAESFKRPVVVDWNNGKAQAGESESEIIKMLSALPK
ncbi:hypothetical protein N0V88_003746 [Collariella sp. IMI 366227]|nr:hypothetical protein N0V88_003746 [Collariella sp. IMI 366227]